MKTAEQKARGYAQKHSGLHSDKDPRFRRYYLAYLAGYKQAILDAAKEVTEENADAENADWGSRPEMSSTVRAWLLNARARILGLLPLSPDAPDAGVRG